MYEKGFEYLLKDGNERIIYGVLKQLHIDRRTDIFEDLVEEGKLAFVTAYEDYCANIAPEQDFKQLNAYIYQRIKWKIIDILRKEWNYYDHFGSAIDDGVLMELSSVAEENLADKFGNVEIFNKLWDCCTENERQYLRLCLDTDLSFTEMAKHLKISRKTVYNYKSKILIKYKKLKK